MQQDRGREASTPLAIPSKGWIDIALRVKGEIGKDRIGLVAAGVAFYMLLALFPGLASFVSIYGLVTDPANLASHLDTLAGIIPKAALSVIDMELQRITSAPPATLGFSFVFSLLLSLWSANKGVSSFFQAMNVAYDEEEDRGFIKLTSITLAFTVAGIVLSIVLLNLVVTIPVVLPMIGLDFLADLLGFLIGPLVATLVVTLGTSALYRWGPSRRPASWRWISPGALLAAVLWIMLSAAFAYYLANFGDYNATYGSLGAVAGLMMWFYISAYVVIVGAEINSEIEHQTRHDTTVEPDRPMGERGAYVADTLGETRRQTG